MSWLSCGGWHRAVSHILIANHPCCSLDNNILCGVDEDRNGEYTIEGITALMEGLQQSNIQALRLVV